MREIEPYIFAGRFLDWELQADVIDSFLERYYLGEGNGTEEEDFVIPEIFEKVIINLNLRLSSSESITKYIKYGEKHFLTSSVLHLYTQLYDRKEVIYYHLRLKVSQIFRTPHASRCSFPCTTSTAERKREKKPKGSVEMNSISKSSDR